MNYIDYYPGKCCVACGFKCIDEMQCAGCNRQVHKSCVNRFSKSSTFYCDLVAFPLTSNSVRVNDPESDAFYRPRYRIRQKCLICGFCCLSSRIDCSCNCGFGAHQTCVKRLMKHVYSIDNPDFSKFTCTDVIVQLDHKEILELESRKIAITSKEESIKKNKVKPHLYPAKDLS